MTSARELASAKRMKDVEGGPLVDDDAIRALVRLVRLAQPLAKGLLQRLLLNLCSHGTTRSTLLRQLLQILKTTRDSSSGTAAQLCVGADMATSMVVSSSGQS